MNWGQSDEAMDMAQLRSLDGLIFGLLVRLGSRQTKARTWHVENLVFGHATSHFSHLPLTSL
jgi:hypothetical protein